MDITRVFSIEDYSITDEDIVKAYLKGFKYDQYNEGTIYKYGDRIIKIFNNRLSIIQCNISVSSSTFVTDEWEEVDFSKDIEEWLTMSSNRTVMSDIGKLKANTTVSGRYIKDVLEEILFGSDDIEFLNNSVVSIDRFGNNSQLEIYVSYKEKQKSISSLNILYDNAVIYSTSEPSNEMYLTINYDGAKIKDYVTYEVIYENNSTVYTGIVLTINPVFPVYYGLLKSLPDIEVDIDYITLDKMIINPNSDIEFIKDSNEYGYMGIMISNNEWRQLTHCMVEDYLNITNSITIKDIYVGGYEYKLIYTYPSMLNNIKITFKFDESSL